MWQLDSDFTIGLRCRRTSPRRFQPPGQSRSDCVSFSYGSEETIALVSLPQQLGFGRLRVLRFLRFFPHRRIEIFRQSHAAMLATFEQNGREHPTLSLLAVPSLRRRRAQKLRDGFRRRDNSKVLQERVRQNSVARHFGAK